ncbi:helix-turn-helix domain-containing protein [Jatrophihabitans lederbergiae]|uniref:Helix-turn-helix domain-containing protein n=1 Tax=Jatrophihabitans lederbergiae TaxID=3075547 RepID=A0ABU2JF84_9ACTN|nr:helix-turn-helix domain-containing protein [Jatrophihabitans sp. DSM 44399]MDT0263658.1 helix-turn-helix domain-containing protein [Jatrophihabitans sp. DSM 44399]
MSAPETAGGEKTRPSRRADARRNREAILRAAREAFEADGVLTSLDGIAAQAGVGSATLYRNFPTRDDLLAAVMADGITAALAEADELLHTLGAQAALVEWIARLTWRLRIWHDLPHCLATAREGASPVHSASDPLLTQVGQLLDKSRESEPDPEGLAHSAIRAEDIYELVLALSWAVDRFGDDETAARRRVAAITAGLFV